MSRRFSVQCRLFRAVTLDEVVLSDSFLAQCPAAAVQACEAQMRRMAGLNKTLAANYNAERVHDECMTSTREAVASK
jgi:anti-sigma factor RsiW